MKFNISKKLTALIMGNSLIMTTMYWMLSMSPEAVTEKIVTIHLGGIIGLNILYGFQTVVNNFIKSKWFSKERFESEQK